MPSPRKPRSRTPAPPAGAPPSERRLPPLLRHAWYGLNQAFRRRIAHLDLTPDQFTVLRNLSEAGRAGLTQSELTRRMASDPNTVASLVERMERSGLLARETDPSDRRARRLRLAPTGRQRFRSARTVAARLQDEVLRDLSPDELRSFLANLQRLSAACQSAARSPSDPDDSPPPQ